MSTINDRMKYAREAAKMDVKDLAAFCGVKPQSVYQWESGSTKNPSAVNVLNTSRATGFKFEWIITGKGPEKLSSEGTAGVGEKQGLYELNPSKEVENLINLIKTKSLSGQFTDEHAKAIAINTNLMVGNQH